jgi:hypothetical protein
LSGWTAALPALQMASALAMKAAGDRVVAVCVELELADDDDGEDDDEPQAPTPRQAAAKGMTKRRPMGASLTT